MTTFFTPAPLLLFSVCGWMYNNGRTRQTSPQASNVDQPPFWESWKNHHHLVLPFHSTGVCKHVGHSWGRDKLRAGWYNNFLFIYGAVALNLKWNDKIREDKKSTAGWKPPLPTSTCRCNFQSVQPTEYQLQHLSTEKLAKYFKFKYFHNFTVGKVNFEVVLIRHFHNHAQVVKVRNSGGPQHSRLDVRTAAWPTKASNVWFSYSHNCTFANGAVFHSVCTKFERVK